MTKVCIEPGICGMTAYVSAHSEDGETVKITIDSPCPAVSGMLKELGDEFDVFDICMKQPGDGPFYEYAAQHFQGHPGCPVCAGIAKCVEAECHMALRKDASIRFID